MSVLLFVEGTKKRGSLGRIVQLNFRIVVDRKNQAFDLPHSNSGANKISRRVWSLASSFCHVNAS